MTFPSPADPRLDPLSPPFYWGCTNYRHSQAHIIDMRTFMHDYRALCGVSAYANENVPWVGRHCSKCRTAHGRLIRADS